MSSTALPFTGDTRLRTARSDGARWFVHAQLWTPDDPDRLVTGAHESAVLLLGGTFDLVGGGTVWPARGTRADAFTGRPMAVFLPPETPFQVSRGRGELLLLAARQAPVAAPATGREALAQKPLLPLAGSGKSFDPTRGEWMPAEAFPSAPESLPPRRFERIPVGPCVVERVLAPDYKAATLSVDEVVLPPGQTLAVAAIPGRPPADETLVFARSTAAVSVRSAAGTQSWTGDGIALVAGAGDDLVVTASTAPAYVVLAWAGKAR